MEHFFDSLRDYCNLLAPSGLEDAVRERILQDIKGCDAQVTVDAVGNIIVFRKGRERREKKLLLAAHMDEVGFMVTYVGDDGYLSFENIGGVDRRVVSGRRLRFCHNGQLGVVASKSIHIQTPDEFGKCEPINQMHIDIGCYSREEAERFVKIGDCATFCPNYEEFGDGLIRSKALDDRFGCVVLMQLLQQELPYDTYFAFNTCEEIGCDGSREIAHRVQPDVAIVLESTTAGDICGTPEAERACALRKGAVISHMDGGTIYDKQLVETALHVGRENDVPCQLKNLVAGGNDSRSFQQNAYGARVLAISAPTRYIHSACSVAAKEDLLAVKRLTELMVERSY